MPAAESVATIRAIETPTHGRYLVQRPAAPPPWPLLVGFHGYREHAAGHLQALSGIPGSERWLLVSVQALHRFYTRDNTVVASWMTREDRELAIGDNIEYVRRVLQQVRQDHPTRRPLVFVGFSQGGAMAYRAAAHHRADGVIVLAADVPPDVAALPTDCLPPVLIGRGTGDDWYTEAKHAADLVTLERLGTQVDSCVFDGGHEWSSAFREAVGLTLSRLWGT